MVTARPLPAPPQPAPHRSRIKGLLTSLGLAAVAALLGHWIPLIGGPVFGLAFGVALKSTGLIDDTFKPGVTYAAKQLLQYAIVLLGATLSLQQVAATGAESLLVMLGTLAACLVGAWLLGRALRIAPNLSLLIGVGTGICGASAIAAVSPVLEADEQEVAYSLSTIFTYNVAAILLFPPLGRLFGMGSEAFGLWAGTAINDTSSVVAAAYAFSQEAGVYGTVVKMARATLIIPVSLALAAYRAARSRRAGGTGRQVQVRQLFPWFILFFLAASLINSLGLLPALAIDWAQLAGKSLIVVAMTAVGLSANLRQLASTGYKPMLLGLLLWVIVASTSLLFQYLTGAL